MESIDGMLAFNDGTATDSNFFQKENNSSGSVDSEVEQVLGYFRLLGDKKSSIFQHPLLFFALFVQGMPIMMMVGGTMILTMFTYYCFRDYGDAELTSSLGLSFIFTNIFLYGPLISFEENFSIFLGAAFGEGNMEGIKVQMWLGIMSFLIVSIFYSTATYVFSGSLLELAGMTEKVAEGTSWILIRLIPMIFLRAVGYFMIVVGFVQGLGDIFWIISAITVVLGCFLQYFFIVWMAMGLKGYIISQLISVALDCAMIVGGVYFLGRKDIYQIPDWKATFNKLPKYFFDSIIFMFAYYCEESGYQIGSIFVAHLHDVKELAAYVAADNTYVTKVCLIVGLSMAFRTVFNIALGTKNLTLAKNIYYLTIFWGFIVGCLIGVLLFFFRSYISKIYTDIEVIQQIYEGILIPIAAYCGIAFISMIITNTLRSTGHLFLGLVLLMFGTLFLNSILGYIFGFVIKLGAKSFFMSFGIGSTIATILMGIILYRKDWNKIDTEHLLH